MNWVSKLILIMAFVLPILAHAETKGEETAVTTDRNVKETEIPVHLEAAKKASAGDSPWMRLFLGLGVVGVMAAGSFLYIRRIKGQGKTPKSGMEIQMLTQHHLGPKKSLAIIRVAGESILIGVTDSNINLIKSLSLLDEDVPTEVPAQFSGVLKSKTQNDEPAAGATAAGAGDLDEREEFSISEIKDVVTKRLKNLRSLT